MTVYALAQLTIQDRAGYERYVAKFLEVLQRFDARLLAADESPEVLEGAWTGDKLVLLSFESSESFRKWADSEEYVTISKDRIAATSGTVLLVHGVDWRDERSRPGLRARELKRVVDYIRDHLSEPLTLAELARVAQCSPWHLARQFRRSMGIPPHQYVLRARVEQARRLLETGRYGIAAAAIQVGFASQRHLSRHMRRILGVTPGAYVKASVAGASTPPNDGQASQPGFVYEDG